MDISTDFRHLLRLGFSPFIRRTISIHGTNNKLHRRWMTLAQPLAHNTSLASGLGIRKAAGLSEVSEGEGVAWCCCDCLLGGGRLVRKNSDTNNNF